jgi:hypothetical protein
LKNLAVGAGRDLAASARFFVDGFANGDIKARKFIEGGITPWLG